MLLQYTILISMSVSSGTEGLPIFASRLRGRPQIPLRWETRHGIRYAEGCVWTKPLWNSSRDCTPEKD